MELNKELIKAMIKDAIQEYLMDKTQDLDKLADSYAINIERIVKESK